MIAALDEAVALARHDDDVVRMAEAATGYRSSGVWHWREMGDDQPGTRAVLEHCLERVTDVGLQARLRDQLGLEHYVAWRHQDLERCAERAVSLARESGDAAVLRDCLVGRAVTLWAPGRAPERIAVARELLTVCDTAEYELAALCHLGTALHTEGDYARCRRGARPGLRAGGPPAVQRCRPVPDVAAVAARPGVRRPGGPGDRAAARWIGTGAPRWWGSWSSPGSWCWRARTTTPVSRPTWWRAPGATGTPATAPAWRRRSRGPAGSRRRWRWSSTTTRSASTTRACTAPAAGSRCSPRPTARRSTEAVEALRPFAGTVATYGSVVSLGAVDLFLGIGLAALGDEAGARSAWEAARAINERNGARRWVRRADGLLRHKQGTSRP